MKEGVGGGNEGESRLGARCVVGFTQQPAEGQDVSEGRRGEQKKSGSP